MGTRGWLIFVYKGKYYVIFNHYDSYPSGMGASIVEQLVALMVRFHGSTRAACDHWGNLLSKITFVQDNPGAITRQHPINVPQHSFENLEVNLSDSSAPVLLDCPITSDFADLEASVFIEYSWVINLDVGTLSVSRPCDCDFTQSWSFKCFYVSIVLAKTPISLWVDDAKYEINEDGRTVSYTIALKRIHSLAIIQRQARRFLARMRALEPGVGVIFKLAKARFEKASAAF